MTPVLEYREVSRTFGGGWWKPREPHRAVQGVSLRVDAGERVALIGESGAGKSTLARMAVGLTPPDQGSVWLFGEDTRAWTPRRWSEARRKVQLLFQDPRAMLHPDMSIGTILAESSRLHRPDRDPEREVDGVLDEVGLSGRKSARPHELSGGEQRRAGLARVLLARPELLLADEPTAGLDAELKANLLELLIERAGPQCAIVLISHDLPLVSWACHRLFVMHRGALVDQFSPADLDDPRHPHTLALLDAAGLRKRKGGSR